MNEKQQLPAKTVGGRSARLLASLYDRSQTTFTLAEAKAITGLSPGSTRSLLHKATLRGLITRLKSGLFALVPPELGSEREYSGNPYLAARALAGTAPYYLSHSTAMELHRMVTQPRLGIFVSMPKRMANRVIYSTEYKFIFIKPEQMFGTQPHWITKQDQVVISDIERTVIDGLRRPEYCGGIAEVARGLWMRHEDMKVDKLVEYAAQLGIGVVRRRLGYLLELYDLAPKDKLTQLRSGLTRTYHLLDPVLPRGGKYTKRWLLQLNIPADELDLIRHT
ncbi:MAG: type IV toxin-antitoxin system AbiEi family antitoxin [Candidatus Acidiferrum sp.]